jgi:hypothetical protein
VIFNKIFQLDGSVGFNLGFDTKHLNGVYALRYFWLKFILGIYDTQVKR